MSTALATTTDQTALAQVLEGSLYPGAAMESINLVLGYCRAAGLDPMQKPVHIVPIWDSKASRMRDVIMPGIGMYRTQAARSGNYAGVSDPEFGPDVKEAIGGVDITYPAWCKVTVKRLMANGMIAEFTATERWKENYAARGGREKSPAPNAMWAKRPYGQLAKCAEAQALRKAFPEIGAAPTAEEMEGKSIEEDVIVVQPREQAKPAMPECPPAAFEKNLAKVTPSLQSGEKTPEYVIEQFQLRYTLTPEQIEAIKDAAIPPTLEGELVDDIPHEFFGDKDE